MGTNRRLKGEGSWGTKTVSGKTYVRYRKVYNGETKEFYGPTKATTTSEPSTALINSFTNGS